MVKNTYSNSELEAYKSCSFKVFLFWKHNEEMLIFSFHLFQILFDQAQRSVKQQLHNFVKEWVNLQLMVPAEF